MSYNNLIEDESFRLLDPSDSSKSLIVEISEGPFEGIRYSYGVVQFKIENKGTEDEHGKLEFEINPEDPSQTDLAENREFVETAGNILMAILENSLESGDYNIEKKDNVSDSEE